MKYVHQTGQTVKEDGDTYYKCNDNVWRTAKQIETHNNKVLREREDKQEAMSPHITHNGVTMLSKKVLNKLNGLKAGESNYVELTQPVSENREVRLDLAHVLAGSAEFQDIKLGEKALVKDISVTDSGLIVKLSVGDVEREESEAVRIALQKLVATTTV